MKQLRLLLVLIALGLFAALMTLPYYRTHAQDVDITLAPQEPAVEAGKRIRFIGNGFYRYERVDSWATDPTGAVIRGEYTKANGNGRVEITFDVPYEAIDGEWKLTARGDESRFPVWASFEVYGRPALTAEYLARVNPTQGPPGMVFAFSANGLKHHEDVSYWITDPAGEVVFANPRGTEANRHGRVDLEWVSPTDAMPGRWVMTLQGYESEEARAIPFIIEGEVFTPTPVPQTPQPTETPTPWYTPLPTYEPLPTATPTTCCAPCVTQPSEPCEPQSTVTPQPTATSPAIVWTTVPDETARPTRESLAPLIRQ
jgi:hypothetical protein